MENKKIEEYVEEAKNDLSYEISVLENSLKMYRKTADEIAKREGDMSSGLKVMQKMIDDTEIQIREAKIILENKAGLEREEFVETVASHFATNGFSTDWKCFIK